MGPRVDGAQGKRRKGTVGGRWLGKGSRRTVAKAAAVQESRRQGRDLLTGSSTAQNEEL